MNLTWLWSLLWPGSAGLIVQIYLWGALIVYVISLFLLVGQALHLQKNTGKYKYSKFYWWMWQFNIYGVGGIGIRRIVFWALEIIGNEIILGGFIAIVWFIFIPVVAAIILFSGRR